MAAKTGMVYFVGAGPGDPELITVAGKKALERAEVIIYDHLASKELLFQVPDTCKRIYVGKEPGKHSKAQPEINRLLIEYARLGKKVVRLKGGDPFVFGRGGEEILELERYHIPYRVIPGVTSAVSAPAMAGIPVTHRRIAQSFHVITGHTAVNGDSAGGSLPDDLAEYAKLPGTLIFLMGLSNLETLVNKLIENGKALDTPAAVVTDGTLPTQRCLRSALKDLPDAVKKAGLTPPGVIIIGETASFCMQGDRELPLSGSVVGITGTEDIYERLSEKLKDLGADVFLSSALHIEKKIPKLLSTAMRNIREYNWIVLTSRSGVRLFFEALREHRVDFRSLSTVKFAVIGKGTEECLREYGFYADLKPKVYTTEALAELLCENIDCKEKLLIPRSAKGSLILTEKLEEKGIPYLELSMYDVQAGAYENEELYCKLRPDYITFESGSGVHAFFEQNEESKRRWFEMGTCAVCIGGVTEDVIRGYGVTEIITASEHTTDGIVDVIINDRKHKGICTKG